MGLFLNSTLTSFAFTAGAEWMAQAHAAALTLIFASKRGDVFNLLWVLVFGFATLNILSLVGRRFDSAGRTRLSLGEVVAIMVVVMSIFLLTWELLYYFKVLPIRLDR